MKKHIIVSIFLLATLSVFAQKKEKIKGNREVTTVIYEVDPFTTLEVKEELKITLLNGTTPKVEVNADENLHEVFNIDVIDGTLNISTSKQIRSHKKLEIFVTISEDLKRIHLESEAEIQSLTTLNINKAEINTMDKAVINLKVKADSLAINSYGKTKNIYEVTANELVLTAFEDATVEASVTTSKLTSQVEFADVKVNGQTDVLYLETKEKGEFVAHELTAKEIHVTTTEQARVILNATEKIVIDAHDRSEIDLLGNPSTINILKFEEEAILRKVDASKKGFLKRIF
ncbi:GIN domain-containing protein [Kordia sp.]|uniref:GIN domain-containing protein n=1 Tax=Kordia sp. TaxID=1965332 RepID=UPI003B5AD798